MHSDQEPNTRCGSPQTGRKAQAWGSSFRAKDSSPSLGTTHPGDLNWEESTHNAWL